MRWQTHALCGISSLWLLIPFIGQHDATNVGVLAAYAAFGALLPDLDAAESKVKHIRVSGIKPFELPAIAIHQALGHRGLLHSLMGLAVFSVVTIPLSIYIGRQPSSALLLGYASHLIADACTRGGVPLLYPQRQRYHVLPPVCRFMTGSLAEGMLLPILATAVLLLLLSHLPSG